MAISINLEKIGRHLDNNINIAAIRSRISRHRTKNAQAGDAISAT